MKKIIWPLLLCLLLCGCALCDLMIDGVNLTFFATLAVAGINAVLFDLADPDNIARAVQGENVGTLVYEG